MKIFRRLFSEERICVPAQLPVIFGQRNIPMPLRGGQIAAEKNTIPQVVVFSPFQQRMFRYECRIDPDVAVALYDFQGMGPGVSVSKIKM